MALNDTQKIEGRLSTLRVQLARVPHKAWIVFGFFVFAALLMALHTAFASRDATLRVKVQHGFRSAQLSLWVDDDQVYSGRLIGTMKKRLGLIPDSVQGSLSETLPISSGDHQVRVRIAADDGSVQENTITGEFGRDTQRTLSITARRSDLNLSWLSTSGPGVDASASAASGSGEPKPGWLERYAGTLLLTAAGSIISALTGFALRELPKQLSRRPSQPTEG